MELSELVTVLFSGQFNFYGNTAVRCLILFTLLFLGSSFALAQQTEGKKKNKLVEFKGFGEWEVWCIDIEQSGKVECNLNQVLRYKDHPDFRAMIVRFYSNGEDLVKLKVDYEWQTSFSRGRIQVDRRMPVLLEDCAKPCVILDDRVTQLSRDFTQGSSAQVRFYDYIVQEFIVDIELSQFTEATESLHKLAKKYR